MMIMMMEEQTIVCVGKGAERGEAGQQPPTGQHNRSQTTSAATSCSPTSQTASLESTPSSPDLGPGPTQATSASDHQTSFVPEAISITLSAEEEAAAKSPNYSDEEDCDDNNNNNKPTSSHQISCPPFQSQQPDELAAAPIDPTGEAQDQKLSNQQQQQNMELRFLVRRREAGALIGKRGATIKRIRETFRDSMLSIPDTGNGPERVVCLATHESSMGAILDELTQLLVEKSAENDEQLELKLLIHSSQAGSIIGMGGQSIKKLRNDSRAAIKIYELCCPFSNERVCAIKARPPVVVSTIKLIQQILKDNPIKGTIKPYDALHFDLMLADKYGGFLPDDSLIAVSTHQHHHRPQHRHFTSRPGPQPPKQQQQQHHEGFGGQAPGFWRPSHEELGEACEHQHLLAMDDELACHLHHHQSHHHAMQQALAAHMQQSPSQVEGPAPAVSPQHYHDHLQQQQQQQRIKQNSTMANFTPSPEAYTAAAAAAAAAVAASPLSIAGFNHSRQVHAFRYHPYALQAPGPTAYGSPSRPMLRHQQQQHYPPSLNGPIYPNGSRLIHGNPSMYHRRGQTCIRMASGFADLQSAARCRHAKPCLCLYMPTTTSTSVPLAGAQTSMACPSSKSFTTHQQAKAPMADSESISADTSGNTSSKKP